MPTFGYDVDRQARREALLEALQAVGGRISQGAGTEGWGALASAAGGFLPAYREGLDRQVGLAEMKRRRALDEEDAAWTRESRARQRQRWGDEERTEGAKAKERAERTARNKAAVAALAEEFPEKKGFIRNRLDLFVEDANFEEQYSSTLEKLHAPAKEEKEPTYVRVTDASGRVVLKPRDEVIAAGGEIRPPRPPRQGEREPRLTPAQIMNEIQQERGAILQEMEREGGPMVRSMGLPAGALDEAERRARAKVKGLVSSQDWERFSRGSPEPVARAAPPPAAATGKFPTAKDMLGGIPEPPVPAPTRTAAASSAGSAPAASASLEPGFVTTLEELTSIALLRGLDVGQINQEFSASVDRQRRAAPGHDPNSDAGRKAEARWRRAAVEEQVRKHGLGASVLDQVFVTMMQKGGHKIGDDLEIIESGRAAGRSEEDLARELLQRARSRVKPESTSAYSRALAKYEQGLGVVGAPPLASKRSPDAGPTVEDIVSALPPELRSRVDDADRRQIAQWLKEGKSWRWILEQAGY